MRSDIRYVHPPIIREIPKDRHAVIEASAGTGKTHTIEHLFMELLLRTDCSIDHLLVLTYTERAAGELRSRIRSMIEKILSSPGDPADAGENCWTIGADSRIKLEESLFSFDKAPIHTIHGFFQRVILENAFSSSRLFEQTLTDSRAVFRQAFMQILRGTFARDRDLSAYLSCWLRSRRSGVDDLEDLLYACHSRKREILPRFDAPAVMAGLEALRQALTDESAPDEIRQACSGSKPKKLHGGATNAIIRKCGYLAELARQHHDSGDLARALCDCRRDFLQYIDQNLGLVSPATSRTKAVVAAVRRLLACLVPFEAAVVQLFLPPLKASLVSDKTKRGLYDFDDMIGYLLDALAGPQGASLLKALRQRYRYALIDESQDTDEHQWNVFRNVFYESEGKNILYLIGDPKQAIYGFRGADVYTYLAARDVICAGGSPISLNENYRSTGPLIAAYNEIFRQDAPRPFFMGSITYDTPVECGRQELRTAGPDGRELTPVVLFEIRPEDARLRAGEYRRRLGRRIAREIGEILSNGVRPIRFGAAGDLRPLRPSDIFILTRKESEGREVSEFLREEGIPFAFYKQEGLFQTREAEHIRDLLLAVERPLDQSRRLKAWLTPFFSVPLERLLACRDLPETDRLVQMLMEWHDLARRRDLQALFAGIVSQSGLISRELFLKDSEREITNYLHIIEILLEEASASGCELAELNRTLEGFIRKTKSPARDEANIQRLETEKEAVQIMTMHKSKGLEAAAVFIYGGYGPGRGDNVALFHEDGRRVLFIGPGEREKVAARSESLQEDQRLLYVAVTRAKARLYLPFVPPETMTDNAARGSYAQLNARLADIVTSISSPGMGDLFSHEVIDPSSDRTIEEGAPVGRPTGPWQPGTGLPEHPDEAERFSGLRRRHKGFDVTSYTRIKHMRGGHVNRIEADEAPDQDIGYAAGEAPEQPLPAGPEFGTALHYMIEHVPFDSLKGSPACEEWLGQDRISELVTGGLLGHGIDIGHAEYSGRLVYNALTAAVDLGHGAWLRGFGSLGDCLREVEFLYPYPEDGHPRLGDAVRTTFQIERGYVRGFIDFLFEHGGRLYMADWKTDILAEYGEDSLRRHYETNYVLQSQLYSVALVKMRGIHSAEAYDRLFGGLLYCFLRAMESPGDGRRGILVARPSWQDILDFERQLREGDEYVGGGA